MELCQKTIWSLNCPFQLDLETEALKEKKEIWKARQNHLCEDKPLKLDVNASTTKVFKLCKFDLYQGCDLKAKGAIYVLPTHRT